ncbi:MAG TPA: hypothetical protein VFN35_05945 [Ktedonobacteraceae bacterium]|nr:hypothetical protein [Ktedonobacteraceae bacterium]
MLDHDTRGLTAGPIGVILGAQLMLSTEDDADPQNWGSSGVYLPFQAENYIR